MLATPNTYRGFDRFGGDAAGLEDARVNLTALCIKRPVATALLTLGVVLAGFFAYLKLPVAPLPQIDFPTITVFAGMPGASPDVMAASVATPLERHLGVIADVSEMTSENTVGQTRIA